MLATRTCIDVDDLDKGITFYTTAFALTVKRRFKGAWAELAGASSPIDLLAKEAGTSPTRDGQARRRYDRHWTPVHLDFVVEQIDHAVTRCTSAGARVEQAIADKAWGRIAILSDPFGHGFCLLEFRGRGYDEILNPGPPLNTAP